MYLFWVSVYSQMNTVCQNLFALPSNSTKMFKFSSKPALFPVSVNICLVLELTQTSWLAIKMFSHKHQYFSLEIKKENGNNLYMHGDSRSKSSCVHCGPDSVLCVISDAGLFGKCVSGLGKRSTTTQITSFQTSSHKTPHSKQN